MPQKPNQNLIEEQECRVCGCTETRACKGVCSWIAYDLCSNCYSGNLIEDWENDRLHLEYTKQIYEMGLVEFIKSHTEKVILSERTALVSEIEKMGYVARGHTYSSGYNQALEDIKSLLTNNK